MYVLSAPVLRHTAPLPSPPHHTHTHNTTSNPPTCPWLFCVPGPFSHLQVCWSAAAGPIQRLHGQLWQSLQLASSLHGQLASGGGGGDGVAGQAIKLEMKVCATHSMFVSMEGGKVAPAPA